MAGDWIIADVTELLLRQVRGALCPKLLPHAEQVAACAPRDKDNEALLNVYLYEIRQYTDYLPQRRVSVQGGVTQNPLALSLQYVIFFSRHAQAPLDILVEQRCLGKLFALFYQTPVLEPVTFHAAADGGDVPVSFLLPKLEERQKQELWNSMDEPLRPAVYLEAAPLLLAGSRANIPRVRTVEEGVLHK